MEKELTISPENLDAYDGLIVSLEANLGKLNLLICICDVNLLREEIINQYEEELGEDFKQYKISITKDNLSLTGELTKLVNQYPSLKTEKQAVITVTGAEKLLTLSFNEEKSELDTFLGYLQWTREALREFPYSIVLWINNVIEPKLQKKAPDFWSWRKGVFRFISPVKTFISSSVFSDPLILSFFHEQESFFISLRDLQVLTKFIESNNQPKDKAKLANVSRILGETYLDKIEAEGYEDYNKELNLGVEYYQKAINLQRELNLEIDLATSLDNLASLYDYQGRDNQANLLRQEASEIRRNPFIPTSGVVKDRELFFARETIIRQVFELLNAGSGVALIGEIGIGKSSLLYAIGKQCDRLSEPRKAIILNLGSIRNDDEYYQTMCHLLEIYPPVKHYDFARKLQQLARQDKRFLLLIDSAENLTWQGFTRPVRNQLRSLAESPNSPLRLVVTSNKSLNKMFADSGMVSPFENICIEIELKPWDDIEMRKFIATRLAKTQINFTEAEIQNLISESKGNPRKLMQLCHQCFTKKLKL